MARREEELERSLLEALDEYLTEQGWSPNLDDASHERVDALASRDGEGLAIALKARRDARRSLLRPMLAEAMLTASAACVARADDHRWRPVAMVGAPRITEEMVASLREDVRELLEGMRGAEQLRLAWGVIDATGRVLLEGEGLHLERAPSRTPRKPPRVPEPFTDRGQWVLKLLVAPLLSAGHVGARADRYSSANALARAAEVSVSTAANVVRYLREKGHLSDSGGTLELHRLPELLELWKQRLSRPSAHVEAEFKLPTSDPEGRLRDALRGFRGRREHAARAFAPPSGAGLLPKQPRACLSALSACRVLGEGIVEGAVPMIYVDEASDRTLDLLGLRPVANGAGSVRVEEPSAPEAVFRAAVNVDGVPCTDILQCWLDMRQGVPRHEEQAAALRAGPLARLFGSEPA